MSKPLDDDDDDVIGGLYENGHWAWDEKVNALVFKRYRQCITYKYILITIWFLYV